MLSVKIDENISMTINPASVTKTGMYPTNNCGGEAGMSGLSTVTIDNQTGVLARPSFKLKIKITDNITNTISSMDENDGNSSTNNPYMYYVRYAVAETDGSCTRSGRFSETTETSSGSGWYDLAEITLRDSNNQPKASSGINTGVSFYTPAYAETSHTYKVWIWIDSEYVTTNVGESASDKLQNATITVSWSDNSTVEHVNTSIVRPAGEAYAVYSADDTSLRFYRK